MSQLQEATAAAAAGDKNKAYVLLADLLKQSPDNVDAWVALSEIVDDEKQKRTFLTRALTLDSNHAEAKYQLHLLDTPPELRQEEAVVASEPELVLESEPEPVAEPELEPELDPLPTMVEPSIDQTMMMPPEKVEELRMQSDVNVDDTILDARPVSDIMSDFQEQASGETIPPWLMGEDGTVLAEVEAVSDTVGEDINVPVESDVPDWLKDDLEDVWEEESAPAISEAGPLSTREIAALKMEEPAKPAPVKPKQKLENWFRWLILAFVAVGLVFIYLLWIVVQDLNLLG